MKKNKYIFRKATPFFLSLLLALSAIDGYALKTVSIKKSPTVPYSTNKVEVCAGNTTATHKNVCVLTPADSDKDNFPGIYSNFASDWPKNITDSITINAKPAAGYRVVWYVDGIKLQGQLLNLSAISGIPSNLSPVGANFNWYNNTDVGRKGDGGAINHVYSVANKTGVSGDRNETLIIAKGQASSITDVQVEFIRDIAYSANPIDVSSEDAATAANGNRGAVLTDRAVWMTSNTAAPAGGLPITDPFNALRYIQFTLTANKYIERIECRRRPNNGDKVSKYNVILYDASWNVVFNKIETLDVRSEDGNTLIPTFNGTVIPDGVGGRDKVTFVEGGPKAARYVRINILDYRYGDGTEGGSDPGTHKPGFDRIKIIETDAPIAGKITKLKVIPALEGTAYATSGVTIEAFNGGHIQDGTIDLQYLLIKPNTGRLVDVAPVAGPTSGSLTNISVNINTILWFRAKPYDGWRVKQFYVNGKQCANRYGYCYYTINDAGNIIINTPADSIIRRPYCLGSMTSQGNTWPYIANGIPYTFVRNATNGTGAGATYPFHSGTHGTLYTDEIIGLPLSAISNLNDIQVEVEFEKEPVIYSHITVSSEPHTTGSTGATPSGLTACKFGITVGPSNWYPTDDDTNRWIDFKFDAGTKYIKEMRFYGRLNGNNPPKVKLLFYNSSITDTVECRTEKLNSGPVEGLYTRLQFCTAKKCKGVRVTSLEDAAGNGYQRIQMGEVYVPITSIAITPPATTVALKDKIDAACGKLKFAVSNVLPAAADYNQTPYFPYTWMVTDMDGKPTDLATIDSDGNLFPLHNGNGKVKVFALANDGYGVKSDEVEVTITNQQYAKSVTLSSSINHLVGTSILDAVITATLTPVPDVAYKKVIWTITTTTAGIPQIKEVNDGLLTLGAETDILKITLLKRTVAAGDGDIVVKATIVAPTNCNFVAATPPAGRLTCMTVAPEFLGVPSGQTTIKIRSATEIESPFISSLNLYPLPFANTIQITDATGSVLQIKNIAGITILTQQISSANETLNLSLLASGMYFFCFEKDGQTKIVKAVKN